MTYCTVVALITKLPGAYSLCGHSAATSGTILMATLFCQRNGKPHLIQFVSRVFYHRSSN